MPMTHARIVAAVVTFALASACSPSGAIIVGKRQVGSIDRDGKISTSRGQPLAWLYPNSIRLRGGVTLPIKTDGDGTYYIPEALQKQAKLTPISHRVRQNGTISQTKNARGIELKGSRSKHARRVVLAVILLTTNSMWE